MLRERPYTTLERGPAFYDLHRAQQGRLFTDHLMFAQDVPVWRDDRGA
ncbi:hypothetical protein GCM10008956_36070 [Deinococcus arenae]|uniref:Microbial-type PARG catalytic domain-containing protein n=1 Tax=Deinococcus arenae TaxID=1452751 RepID=A0A8H9LAE5_9DEIO|nr:hypothetical protein GCM10008956_36070 [Deinococcus arenae]